MTHRLRLPFTAALAGIISFTMLGLIVNGIYAVVHAAQGERYVWGFWGMWCGRDHRPLLLTVSVGVVLVLGVVGHRMLQSRYDRNNFSMWSVTGLALLMLPLWNAVCLVGFLVHDLSGAFVRQFFPFAGGEAADLSYQLTESVYVLMLPIVVLFVFLLVRVIKERMLADAGWARSTVIAATLGSIMVIFGTLFWSEVTITALRLFGITGV
jgi:hypothetical protein